MRQKTPDTVDIHIPANCTSVDGGVAEAGMAPDAAVQFDLSRETIHPDLADEKHIENIIGREIIGHPDGLPVVATASLIDQKFRFQFG